MTTVFEGLETLRAVEERLVNEIGSSDKEREALHDAIHDACRRINLAFDAIHISIDNVFNERNKSISEAIGLPTQVSGDQTDAQ